MDAAAASSQPARRALIRRAAAFVLVAAVAMLRFAPALRSPEPLGDELAYDRAFARLEAGGSAYDEPGFLYPPVFARAGVWLRAHGGSPTAPLYLLRGLDLLGLLVVVAISSSLLPWGLVGRTAASLAMVLLSPAVRQGVELGNVTFLVAGAIVGAMWLWPQRVIPAGLLLGASLAIKPLGPAAVLALAVHRPADAPAARARWTAGLAAAVGGVLLLAVPGLGSFFAHSAGSSVLESTVSPVRLLVLAGGRPSPLWITLPLLAGFAWWLRRQTISPPRLLAVAVAACVATTPMVWNHTLVLTLPLQAMAWHAALRPAAGREHRRRRWEIALVALSTLALHLAEGATGITDRGPALQLVAVLPPLLAPVFLLAYVWTRGGASGGRSPTPPPPPTAAR